VHFKLLRLLLRSKSCPWEKCWGFKDSRRWQFWGATGTEYILLLENTITFANEQASKWESEWTIKVQEIINKSIVEEWIKMLHRLKEMEERKRDDI